MSCSSALAFSGCACLLAFQVCFALRDEPKNRVMQGSLQQITSYGDTKSATTFASAAAAIPKGHKYWEQVKSVNRRHGFPDYPPQGSASDRGDETMHNSASAAAPMNGSAYSRISLPYFETPADLHMAKNSKWAAYLQALYGSAIYEEVNFPLDLSKFYVLNKKYLADAHIEFPSTVKKCPDHDLDVFWAWDWTPGDMLHIHHVDHQYTALTNDAWVEVTHCEHKKPRPVWEQRAYFMYFARGSGVFYNIGKTKAFQTWQDAKMYFMGPSYKESDEGWHQMIAKAGETYKSIQILGHVDQWCGGHGMEIIDLHHTGYDSCSLPVAGGFGHCACDCFKCPWGKDNQKWGGCLSCNLDCGNAPALGALGHDAVGLPLSAGQKQHASLYFYGGCSFMLLVMVALATLAISRYSILGSPCGSGSCQTGSVI